MSEAKPALEAEAPRKNLAQKIVEIQDSVGVVHKKGKNKEHNYDFLRIEDAVTAVNKLMAAKSLLLTPTLQKRPDGSFYYQRDPHNTGKGYMVSLTLDWTLEDAETGEKRHYDIPGEGYDSTDKAGPKAITSSRKQAIILIFNLPIGNDIEERGTVTFEEGKEKQKKIAANKVAEAAARGVPSAIDAMSQAEPEKKVTIARPEEYNGHYIIASGYTAIPQLETFFVDTGCKRIDSKKTGKTGWKVPAEYEKGLLGMCTRLGLEIEG